MRWRFLPRILVWTSLVHRDTPARKAHYEHGIGKKHLMLTAVISSIIFFGVDGTMLYNSFVDLSAEFYKFPTAAEHGAHLTVDVIVVDADDGKPYAALLCHWCPLRPHGHGHRRPGHALDEAPPIGSAHA